MIADMIDESESGEEESDQDSASVSSGTTPIANNDNLPCFGSAEVHPKFNKLSSPLADYGEEIVDVHDMLDCDPPQEEEESKSAAAKCDDDGAF